MDLNSYHQHQVKEFLQFSHKKRSQCLRSLHSSIDTLLESRLLDDNTFTNIEVKEMVASMWSAVLADVEAELISSTHMSALLLQQLYAQAEKVHLKLQSRVADIENKELLEEMSCYEQKLLSGSAHGHLEPINFTTSGGQDLLQREIDRLTNENAQLKDRIKHLESKTVAVLKDQHNNAVVTKDSNSGRDSTSGKDDKELLKTQLQQLTAHCDTLESSLTTTNDELSRVRKELDRSKAELDRKFNETAQYNNMKKMLLSKNEQIKELRATLKQYEN